MQPKINPQLARMFPAIALVGAMTAGAVMLARSPQLTAERAAASAPAAPNQQTSQKQTVTSPPSAQTVNESQDVLIAKGKALGYRTPISKEFKEAFEAQAARSQAAEKEARDLMEQGRFDEARKACYRSLELSPRINGQATNMAALQLLGDIEFVQGHYRQAIEAYDRARKHTRNLELDWSTALAYLRLNDLDSARKFFNVEKFFHNRMVEYNNQSEEQVQEFLSQLPQGDDARTFEANIYLARAAEQSMYGGMMRREVMQDFERASRLFPRNALIASKRAASLGWGDEAASLWARAAAFGKGKVAQDAWSELRRKMGAEKAQQAVRDARSIR